MYVKRPSKIKQSTEDTDDYPFDLLSILDYHLLIFMYFQLIYNIYIWKSNSAVLLNCTSCLNVPMS